MSVDRSTLLFFDASCLIAAAGSPNGGSGFLLSLGVRGLLRMAVSLPVLLEADRNIRHKLPGAALTRFRELVQSGQMRVAAVPSLAQRRHVQGLINDKDVHVVAAAIAAGAPFLLTLDQPLIAQINGASLAIQA